ncbi:PAS domain-containing sensor histidine kinase [Mangrovibacterium lignilyticum]|uniref:PAS domain-containing sensor histidine kinase n=1 Tax=Mangrovibacterium lignilyticum TaxID=2668052 RepID=UPI0013D5B5BF|nr:PAS domain-containing sensor histidine kinase [Mangrovibacterium lignilyticum]
MDGKRLSIDEEKFRNLIELATDGILIGANDGIVIEANSTFCTMIGRKKEELIGRFIADIPFAKTSVEQTPFRFDLLRKGQLVVSERELLRSDGTKITIEMRTKMMPDGTYQSIYRDISERKKYELQLLDYANELSELNEDKDHFITILAHDLVSPFNTILGYLGVLSADFDNLDRAAIRKQLDIVHNASTKAFNLLQEILTWSRSNSGTMSYEPEFFNLKDICQKTVDILEPIAENKNIEITNAIDDDVQAYTDANMLRVIIRNLLTNALKFTSVDGKVTIGATEHDGEIVISVKDTGKGIAKGKLATLFKNIHNKPTEGTSREIGNGLGLVICKMLAERQGGSIGVESEVGIGSKFFVRIPARRN